MEASLHDPSRVPFNFESQAGFGVRNVKSYASCLEGMADKVVLHSGELQNRNAVMDLIKSCGKERDLEKARRVHADILRSPFLTEDIYLGNALVSMYAKCDSFGEAHEVFENLPIRGSVSWNALISGYVQHNHGQEAWKCFARMLDEGVSPNIVTFICVLKACGILVSLQMGEAIHAEIGNQGLLERNIVLGNTLVDMYGKCGALDKAWIMLMELPQRDVVSWNVLISSYAHQGLDDDAIKCYWQMQDEGLSPNSVTFTIILKSCTNARSLMLGEDIHVEICKQKLLEKNIVVSNTLLGMYAKCGELEKSVKLFEELLNRDIVSWNTLIGAYVDHGFHCEALGCFKRMQDEGISPNNVTFICISKVCGRTGSLIVGESIHADISNRGLLQKDIVLGTALVDMYGRCGAVEKAKEVFDKLPQKNVVTWNALISGYAQTGHAKEAVECFQKMQDEGVHPETVTFTCLLKVCSNIASVELGEEIHAEVIKLGLFGKDVVIGNAILDMYIKCDMLEKAKRIFEELPKKTIISWNLLIVGCIEHGLGDEALKFFRQMKREPLTPDAITFSCILKACGSMGLLVMGEEMHSVINRCGLLEKDTVLGGALMDMYLKCGVPQKAQEVFEQLLVRDVVAWNVLISGYVKHGLDNRALNCFRHMQDEGILPDAVTFICVLKVCGSIGFCHIGEAIHMQVSKMGLLQEYPMLGTALVDMYMKCGLVGKAQKVFQELPIWDAGSWNALISGYCQHNRNQEALNCFEMMQNEGLTPDAVTYICVLKACGSIQSSEVGKQIHIQAEKQGLLQKNVVLGTALVDMYAKCGALEEAQEAFDELQERNVVSWNALIAGYAQYGIIDKALTCFTCMQNDGMCPDVVTYLCIVNACSNLCLLEVGETMHTKIKNVPMLKDIALGTALVDMYAKCGLLNRANEVFDELPFLNVVSYNSLISGYAHLGEARKVIKLLSMMIMDGILPNAITFLGLLTACCHAGLVKEGQTIFEHMGTPYCLTPAAEHYTCMVNLFGRAGQFDKAALTIERVTLHDPLPLWLSLLGACNKYVNMEFGMWAFQKSLESDETCATAYVYIGNMHVTANLHREAQERTVNL